MKNYRSLLSCIVMLILSGSFSAYATETKLVVRAKAKDAKFIGTSIGGAYVIVRNKLNQKILAEGITEGTPGNTKVIMETPHKRKDVLADDQTAKFSASIDIAEPVLITIEVMAPMNHKQSQVRATTELWLIPGKHIEGDGIILEIPGFIIDILHPRTHNFIQLTSLREKSIEVKANIVMMCGCIITKGGVWNADDMEVKVLVKKDGKFLQEIVLRYAEANLFQTNIAIPEKGNYECTVYAFDERSGNTGVDKVNFVVY
jgi:hypothetical protein